MEAQEIISIIHYKYKRYDIVNARLLLLLSIIIFSATMISMHDPWTSTDIGNYIAEAVVWESNESYSAFSTVWTIEFEVEYGNSSLSDSDLQRTNDGSVSLDRVDFPAPWDFPPLKQLRAGIDPREISCYGELIRIYHPKSNIPACVKENTFYHLLLKGWQISIPPPKCSLYEIEDPVCGVDGVTYANQCHLNARGMKMEYTGECN